MKACGKTTSRRTMGTSRYMPKRYCERLTRSVPQRLFSPKYDEARGMTGSEADAVKIVRNRTRLSMTAELPSPLVPLSRPSTRFCTIIWMANMRYMMHMGVPGLRVANIDGSPSRRFGDTKRQRLPFLWKCGMNMRTATSSPNTIANALAPMPMWKPSSRIRLSATLTTAAVMLAASTSCGSLSSVRR